MPGMKEKEMVPLVLWKAEAWDRALELTLAAAKKEQQRMKEHSEYPVEAVAAWNLGNRAIQWALASEGRCGRGFS